MMSTSDEAGRMQHQPHTTEDGARSRAQAALLPLAVLLLAAGFAGIVMAWLAASGTADTGLQLQAMLSGGFGGMALVILGAALLHVRLADHAPRWRDDVLERLLAASRAPFPAGAAPPDLLRDALMHPVLASHASYHLAACDLVEDRDGLTPLTLQEAVGQGLDACRVCLEIAD